MDEDYEEDDYQDWEDAEEDADDDEDREEHSDWVEEQPSLWRMFIKSRAGQ